MGVNPFKQKELMFRGSGWGGRIRLRGDVCFPSHPVPIADEF